MTLNVLRRRYAMPVRLHHRELLSSFGDRTLAANGETSKHRDHLIRLATTSLRLEDRSEAWLNILRTKTGRPDLERVSPLRTHTIHDDNHICRYCHRGIPVRQMCELCAHGEEVWQRPHFDDIVCLHHRRWLGIHRGPQSKATKEQVRAAIRLTRLRRAGRVDARLYLFLVDTLGRERQWTTGEEKEKAVFVEAVALARAVTDRGFLSELLRYRTEYDTAWSLLQQAVTTTLGRESAAVSRAMWLYLRPTFAALRWAWLTETPYEPLFPHDIVAPPVAADTYTSAPVGSADKARVLQAESFTGYLAVTGDTLESVNKSRVEASRLLDDQASGRLTIPYLCAEGHPTVVSAMAGTGQVFRRLPKCGVCSGRTIIPGINDLATLHPHIAAELDEVLSRRTAQQLSRGSSKEVAWKCDQGHRYWATVNNRVLNGTSCPWCWGRVLPGVTDLTTTHPHVALELDSWKSALRLTANSEDSVHWKCTNGHTYVMRVVTRVKLDMCPECHKEKLARDGSNITVTHPGIAKYWHPWRNGKKRPEHYTHGSAARVWWTCDHEHAYPMRVERKTAGLGCPVCAGRRLTSGVNDLATREPVMVLEFHPYQNGVLEPHEIFPSDKKYAWKCLLAGHTTWQTVQHRRQSRGCTECEREERILVKPPLP